MDWLMKQTTEDKIRGIRWNLTSVLEDLDRADDTVALSSQHKDVQEKYRQSDQNCIKSRT